MPGTGCRAAATAEQTLTSLRTYCIGCGQPIWVAYHTHRTITTLKGNYRLTLSWQAHKLLFRSKVCVRVAMPFRPCHFTCDLCYQQFQHKAANWPSRRKGRPRVEKTTVVAVDDAENSDCFISIWER